MKKVDYIIVGGGFASFFLAHQFIRHQKSFVVFHDGEASGSHISAGVCNPVILKRFNTFWKSSEQLEYLDIIFGEIEAYLGKNYLKKELVARIFHNDDEKVQWQKNAIKENLSQYLSTDFINLNSVHNPFGCGVVKHSCHIDVASFFKDFSDHLSTNGMLISKAFNYDKIDLNNNVYEDFSFQNIIFCEGIKVNHNPFFSDLPVKPNKGHCMEIKLDHDLEPYIIKKKHFLFALSNGNFYCGGTYDHGDFSEGISESSVKELEEGLAEFYKKTYQVDKIKSAFRAVVQDRKPILGRHPKISQLYVFNGLGTRGVLNGTYFSKVLYDYLENQTPLEAEVDVQRFYH